MTTRVTITKAGRSDPYGVALVVGQIATVTDQFALDLVRQGFATDTDNVMGFNPSSFVNHSYSPDTAKPNQPISGELAGINSFVNGLSVVNGTDAAAANTSKIQAALTAGGLVQILTPGTYYVDTQQSLVISSKTKLVLGSGVVLTARSGRVSPLIRNKYAGNLIAAPQLVRASNIVTVSEPGHTKINGDQVFVSLGSTASFRGLVTVQGVIAGSSWQYASTGTDGNAGAITTYYSLIPVRQTLAGSAFVATAFYVTVTEAGHDKFPGMHVWIGKDGGDNFAPGISVVSKVTADTWTYATTAAAGTATGTFAMSYDYDIEIDGGVIDGNRAGAGNLPLGSGNQHSTVWLGCVSNCVINSRIGGSLVRGIAAFNAANLYLGPKWSCFDNLVGCQVEGGGRNLVVNQALPGSSALYTTSAQKTDDYVAFTGTAIVGGAGNYDDFASPYGLSGFYGIDVQRICPINALNGVKLTAHNTCPYYGTIHVGAVFSRNLDNTDLYTRGNAVCIFDDGPGLVGTTIDVLDITGPIEWTDPLGSGGILLGGAGTINVARIRGLSPEVGTTYGVQLAQTMTVKLLDIFESKLIPLGSSKPVLNFPGGVVRRLVVRNSHMKVGALQPCIYLGGGTVNEIALSGNLISAETSGAGDLIQCDFAASLTKVSFDGTRTEPGAFGPSSILVFSDVAMGNLDIFVDNHDVLSASGIRSSGTGLTGTVNMYLGGAVKWTAIGGNNFLQVGGGTWNLWGGLNNRNSLPATKMFLIGFGTPTYKSIGFTQVLTPGATPAVDCGLGNNMTLAIGANATATLGAPTNVPPAGTAVTMTFTQDATGGRNMAFNAAYIFPTAWSNTGNTANTISEVTFVSNGTKLIAQGANVWHT